MDSTDFNKFFWYELSTKLIPIAMDDMLSSVKWQTILMYTDDMVIFFKAMEEHQDHIQTVLRLPSRTVVSLKEKSCFFFEDKINHLSQFLPPDGLRYRLKDV